MEESCSNVNCDVKMCTNSHPKASKYFQNFRRCKFSPSANNHNNQLSLQAMKIETMERKFEAQDNEINQFKKK